MNLQYPLADIIPTQPVDTIFHELMQLPYRERRAHVRKGFPAGTPRFLYKYRALHRSVSGTGAEPAFTEKSITPLQEIIVDCRLRLSSPAWFNDPFDMTANLVTEGSLEERRSRFRHIVRDMAPKEWNFKQREATVQKLMSAPENAILEHVIESFGKHAAAFGVTCFAADRPRDVLMWSHYGGEHAGVCLQFEYARDIQTLGRALHVEYNDEYPVVNWVKNFEESIAKCLLRKHTCWRYENEVRISHANQAGKFLELRPDALTGIILGCKADAGVRALLDQLLSERRSHGLPEVKLYRAHKNRTRYEIDIRLERE